MNLEPWLAQSAMPGREKLNTEAILDCLYRKGTPVCIHR